METIKISINGVSFDVDKEKLSEVKEGETLAIDNSDVVTYTKSGFDTYTNNVKKDEYENTKTKANEMAQKHLKNAFGYEVEGYKDADKFAEGLKAKIITDANIAPNEQINALTNDLNNLKQNYTTQSEEFASYKNGIEAERVQVKKDNTLIGLMPDNIKVDKDIALIALRTKIGLDIDFSEDGKAIKTVNGNIQKDNTMEPVQLNKELMSDELERLNLLIDKKTNRSSGFTDESGNGDNGYEDFVNRMSANNINEGSSEFNEKLSEEIANGLKI